MIDIITALDTQWAANIGSGQFYGLCKLIIDDSEGNYPRTISGTVQKVTPNDSYNLAIYHRLLDGTILEDEDLSFGRTKTKKNTQRIRTVVIIKYDQGILIEDIYNVLPEMLTVTGYESVYVSSDIALIVDHDAVYVAEWGQAYKDKYQMRFKIYALEYNIEIIKC